MLLSWDLQLKMVKRSKGGSFLPTSVPKTVYVFTEDITGNPSPVGYIGHTGLSWIISNSCVP